MAFIERDFLLLVRDSARSAGGEADSQQGGGDMVEQGFHARIHKQR